jgi:excisionase family DNA binding protein
MIDADPREMLCYIYEPGPWHVESSITLENRVALSRCLRCPALRACDDWYQTLDPKLRIHTIAGGRYYGVSGKEVSAHKPGGATITGDPDELLSTGEAAALVGLSSTTIGEACRRGTIVTSTTPKGHYRIRRADLAAWVKTRNPELEQVAA